MNTKGGCGKSTISTNLSVQLALQGYRTLIVDYDKQGTSLDWINRRDSTLPIIQGINAAKVSNSTTRTWQLQAKENVDILINDIPAGTDIVELPVLLDKTDILLIPVLPSSIDIHATTRFIETLLINGKIRSRNIKIGIIANRVKKNTVAFRLLKHFLSRLEIPFIAQFNESQNYPFANENGLGIHELSKSRKVKDLEQWEFLSKWIEKDQHLNQLAS